MISDRFIRLVNAITRVYSLFRHGDLFESWKMVMRVTVHDDEREERKKAVFRVNIIMAFWYFASSMRIASMVLATDYPTHWFGKTVAVIGSSSKLFALPAFFYLLMCGGLRLATAHLVTTNRMIFLQTVKRIVSGKNKLLQQKTAMARKVLLAAFTGSLMVMSDSIPFFTVMFYYNLRSATTVVQICCWILWWIVDIWMLLTDALEFLILPATWIVVVLSHRMDVHHLIHKVKKLATYSIHTQSAHFNAITKQYASLVHRSVEVNRFSAPILFVISLLTPPAACTALFGLTSTDSYYMAYVILIASITISIGVSILLMIAASITSLSEELHSHLCSTACKAHYLSSTQKERLLEMIEETGAEASLFALYTLDGHQYTTEMLLLYAIELGLQYTLLLTLNGYIGLV